MPRLGEQPMLKSGQKATESGNLKCTNCGEEIDIDRDEHIPPCPKCAGVEWEIAGVGAGAGSRGGSSSRSR